MKSNIVRVAALLLLVALAVPMWSQDVIEKAVTSINQHLLLKEFDKAWSYATFILRYYRTNQIPLDTLDAVERAVQARAEALAAAKNWEGLLELKSALSEAPASVQAKAESSVQKAEQAIAAAEAERLRLEAEQKRAAEEERQAEAERVKLAQIEAAIKAEQAAEAAREAARLRDKQDAEAREAALLAERARAEEAQRAQIDRIIEENRKLELEKEKLREAERVASLQRQQELELNRQEAEEKYRQEMTRMLEAVNQTNANTVQSVATSSMAIVAGLGILAVFVILGITIVVIISLRQQKLQHEQFKSTLNAMQAMRTVQPNYDLLALPFAPQDASGVRALPGGQALMIEGRSGPAQGDHGPGGAAESAGLKDLLEKCQMYGQEIDKATGRRNASRLVADLVYKLSRQLGYSDQDSIRFFAVGLVYDIGFLNIDATILRAEHINEDQFATIKTHTTIGLNMVFFIDEANRELFKDGVSKHHENMDGSGYPYGLKGESIPYIARALRVAESYVALISSREYKQIRDRDAAIADLKQGSSHYDQTIVAALDAIV